MPRRYQHISNYENEIIEMRKKGVTTREIADRFGLSREQIKGFIKRRSRVFLYCLHNLGQFIRAL